MKTSSEIVFEALRMYIALESSGARLFVSIASGFADFEVTLPLSDKDLQVFRTDSERPALFQAALHHPFQLRETALSETEQRRYLDIILHSPVAEVEAFLTTLDHGSANGGISNMLKITSGRDQQSMRRGTWFA